jgi:hypothetical protein
MIHPFRAETEGHEKTNVEHTKTKKKNEDGIRYILKREKKRGRESGH